MAQFISMPQDPVFSSVTLTSDGAEFNPDSIKSGYMTKEEHLLQLYERIVALEAKHDECCRDIIFWEARVQIVRAHKSTVYRDSLNSGGVVVSSFSENIRVGKMRRGTPYTVTFPVKWNSDIYTTRNAQAISVNNCTYPSTYQSQGNERLIVNYRIVEDDELAVAQCPATLNNFAGFWCELGSNDINLAKTVSGAFINYNNNWGMFVHEIADDGTVTITDNRRSEDFNVIRYYTQWVLRECSDGSMITDPQ